MRKNIIIILCLFMLTACSSKEEVAYADTVETTKFDTLLDYDFTSGWIAYWDMETVEVAIKSDISEVVPFAVLFKDDKPVVPKQTTEIIERLYDTDKEIYLSFVNDTEQPDGSYIQKEKAFIERIVKDENSINNHINDILKIADEYDLDGIEIDYENIKNDTELWEKFSVFLDILYEKCKEKELKLRVVLSYDSAKYTDFPQGPMYVIMCYNLYGMHSGAGPKADEEFLQKTFDINESLKPNISMAYASGGFVWKDKKVTSITEAEVNVIIETNGIKPTRDIDSGVMNFKHDGAEIWYADETTLDYWIYLGIEAGFDEFALWRF